MISVLKIRGQAGSKMEFFGSFSKSIYGIYLIFGLKEIVMILHMCVKCAVMYEFGSQETGSNGVKNGVFREFLEKYMWNIADFRAGRDCYDT